MDRRKFIQTGIAGVAGLSLVRTGLANIQMTVPSDISVDRVKLGKTGLKVSRIAMGTGTKGWNYQSNQTRLGLDNFVKIARHGYERGIRFFDMADMYGSQPFVGKALKELPREKLTLMTKMWTYDEGSEKRESVSKTLDRFRHVCKAGKVEGIFLLNELGGHVAIRLDPCFRQVLGAAKNAVVPENAVVSRANGLFST